MAIRIENTAPILAISGIDFGEKKMGGSHM